MMPYKKTNIPGLYKDTTTGVIINRNKGEYEAIKAKRAQAKKQADLAHKVERMESEISDIKTLLLKLVDKL